MTVTRESLQRELRRVALPDGGDVISRDMVRALSVDDGKVSCVLEVPPELGTRMEPVRRGVESVLKSVPGVRSASVVMTAHAAQGSPKQPPDLRIGRHPTRAQGVEKIAGVKHIIAIASGKGGVGKSTLAANLSVALARLGGAIGLLDADIHGPSMPMMMGVSERPVSPDGKLIRPLTAHGVRLMSIGLLLPQDEAVIWRGPMLMGALQQMLQQVQWGELDILLVDLPPGTGDVQLTLCQRFELAGAVIVCTPQEVALIDARRAVTMFKRLNIPILGMVENMSYRVCPDCGEADYLFGEGGVRREAEASKVPFLGEIPFAPAIGRSGDNGKPVTAAASEASDAFEHVARQIRDQSRALSPRSRWK
ncbi:MAG: Mrp/NBP35 family ATP-binding protein [Rhodobacteraceae bacterium]|nr:Mrp/NBP35 family ATP-binding protein [Paracoccaceae bacterium]